MEKYRFLLNIIIEELNINRVIANLSVNEQLKASRRLYEISEIKKGYYTHELETIYEILKPKADEKKILELARRDIAKREQTKKLLRKIRRKEDIEHYENERRKKLIKEEEEENKFWTFIIMLIINREMAIIFYSMEPDLFIQILLSITQNENKTNSYRY